jgi:hypothetical protein
MAWSTRPERLDRSWEGVSVRAFRRLFNDQNELIGARAVLNFCLPRLKRFEAC